MVDENNTRTYFKKSLTRGIKAALRRAPYRRIGSGARGGQHVIADRSGGCGKLIDADLTADQRDEVTPANRMVAQSGDVDCERSIETRPAIGQRVPPTIASAPGAASVALAARG